MLRSLLLPLDGSSCCEAAASLALDWAERFEARLVVLTVMDQPSIHRPELVPLGAGAFEDKRDGVAALLARLRDRTAETAVAAEVREETGDPADRILREAQRCDVTILGSEKHFEFEAHEHSDAPLSRVLRGSPRPLVIVPPTPRPGHDVLLAYSGGREAARTLQIFAMLGLAADATVDVLTVHRDHAQAHVVARAAGDFLGARAVKHRVRPVASTAPPAEVILEEIARRRPSLVVMGAHGYHSLRDLFAASVTHAVLEHCPVPVFVGA